MTQTTKNQPVENLFDGPLKAAIWANPGKEEGSLRYSVELSRNYKDGQGNWQSSNTYSGAEILRIARLANLAYTRIGEYRQAFREQAARNARVAAN